MSNPNPFNVWPSSPIPPAPVGTGAPMTVPQMPTTAKEPAPTLPPDTVIVTDEKPSPVAGIPGFTVKLRDNPELFIPASEAHDRLDAIEVYKVRCGIICSVHPFEVAAATG